VHNNASEYADITQTERILNHFTIDCVKQLLLCTGNFGPSYCCKCFQRSKQAPV